MLWSNHRNRSKKVVWLKRAFGWLGSLAAVLVIGIVLLAMASVYSPSGTHFLTMQTSAMGSSLPVGSLVSTRPADNYQPGDIVAFPKANQRPEAIHRIVAVRPGSTENLYTTQADANLAPDADPIPQSVIIGKVWWNIPFIGYLFSFAKTPAGLLILVIVPGLILLHLEWRKVRQAWYEYQLHKKMKRLLIKQLPTSPF